MTLTGRALHPAVLFQWVTSETQLADLVLAALPRGAQPCSRTGSRKGENMRLELKHTAAAVAEPTPAPIDLELSLEDYEAAVAAAAERGLTLFEYVVDEASAFA
jgi:hypothetical protein